MSFFKKLGLSSALTIVAANFLFLTTLLLPYFVSESYGELKAAVASFVLLVGYPRATTYLVALVASVFQCLMFITLNSKSDLNWKRKFRKKLILIVSLATVNTSIIFGLFFFVFTFFDSSNFSLETLEQEMVTAFQNDSWSLLQQIFSILITFIVPTMASLGFFAIFFERKAQGYVALLYSSILGLFIVLRILDILEKLDEVTQNFIILALVSPIFYGLIAFFPFLMLITICRLPTAIISASNIMDKINFGIDYIQNEEKIRERHPGMTREGTG